MNNLPALFGKLRSQLPYILGIPAFFLCFMLIYQPSHATTLLQMGQNMLSFNTTIIMCILLGVMLISRALMTVLSHHQLRLNWVRYVYWEVAEVIAMSMFMALYLTLMYKGAFPYFHVVGQSLYALLIICIYPYVIFNLSIAYMAQKEEQATYDDSLMRFVDNTQRVKLMIASSAVLYIKAEENYVHIRYMEGDRLKEYALRASMKSLEELMHKHGLIRCQRSYYVNPQHIKVLRRDKEGMIYAEMDVANTKSIPVSPKYYEAVAKWL